MSRPNTYTLILLGLVVLVTALFFTTFERKERVVNEPPSGPAASDRFFALERLLGQLGQRVYRDSHVPQSLDEVGTLVIGSSPATMDSADAARLLDWVDEGGRLVVPMSGAADMRDSPFWISLRKQGVTTAASGCAVLTGTTGEKPLRLCGNRVSVPAAYASGQVGDHDGDSVVSVAYGEGQIVLLSSMTPLIYRSLKEPVAQRFAARLFAVDVAGQTIWVIPRLEGPRLWSMLLSRGWPALLAATLLLVAWAVSRAPRFGPLIESRTLDRRALLEHVQAAGEFLYRRDRGRGLHRRLCVGALARVRRRDPATDDLEGEALYARLAERYRLAPAHIARAFEPPADAQAFRESVAVLARLRRLP